MGLNIGRLLAIVALSLNCLGQDAASLSKLYQDLIEAEAAGRQSATDIAGVLTTVPVRSSGEITEAIPYIISATTHQDDKIKLAGLMALFAIGQRPDGAMLLKPTIATLGNLLENSSDPRVARMAGTILATMHPQPLPEVIAAVLTFVQKTNENMGIQAGVSEILMDWAYDKPGVLAAIDTLARRPLSSNSRIGLLDAIGRKPRPDDRLYKIILVALRDSDAQVRHRAIYQIAQIGSIISGAAAADLQAIAVDPNETPANRIAAQKALRREPID